jgi:hypothetical protein
MGSLWELYSTPTERATPLGMLCACSPKPSSTALKPRGITELDTIPEGTTRLYARQIKAGYDHELKVYFSPQSLRFLHPRKPLYQSIFGKNPKTLRTAAEFHYIVQGAREDADVAVDVFRVDTHPEVVLSLCDIDGEHHDTPVLKQRVEADRGKVDAALYNASRWNWHLNHTNPIMLDSAVSLEFGKLGECAGGDFTPSSKPWANLNQEGVIRFHVRPQDEYGIKIISHDNMPLHVCAFYFNSSDFSIGEFLGSSNLRTNTPRHAKSLFVVNIADAARASGKKDAEIAPRGHFLIGSTGDGGAPISFNLAEPDMAEVGYIKVVWSTDTLDLNYLGRDRSVKVCTRRNVHVRWGTLLVKVLQLP